MIDFMQTKLGEALRKGKRLSDAVAWFEMFDYQFKQIIIDWIRYDQLRKQGVDEDGEVIGFYSYVTSLINPEKKFNTHFTLEDSGEFYKSMYLVALKDSIVIEADGQKEDENLFEKYGDGIIGLTEENMERLRQIVRQKFIDYAKKFLAVN